jgi:hypothetical protein
MRREFLQLAETLDHAKHSIGGYFLSTKLDGTRCLWDGGISRGVATEEVPWAGIIDPKTGERKKKIKPVATGLWSRYGSPIIAPDWFLNRLPSCFLDGELFAGEGNFQLCRSICSGDSPDPRFDQIKYAVYSAPSFASLFQSGEIKNTNMRRLIDNGTVYDWVCQQLEDFDGDFRFCMAENFEEEVRWLKTVFESENQSCYMLPQIRLPLDLGEAHIQVAKHLDTVVDRGGEGVILRDPLSAWTPKRHKGLLKWKPHRDAEGIIIGFTSGRRGKEDRCFGKIGALIVEANGKSFKVSGLTDEEREFESQCMTDYAKCTPDSVMPIGVTGRHFKRGQVITYQYMTLTKDGLPREPRYYRKWEAE